MHKVYCNAMMFLLIVYILLNTYALLWVFLVIKLTQTLYDDISTQALKLKTIVRGDAPTSLVTTGLCRKEVSFCNND